MRPVSEINGNTLLTSELLEKLAEAEHAPTCPCGDWGRAVALVLALASGHECAAHPAIAESVARIFHGWDGADAAHARSITAFKTWHADARAQVKGGRADDRLAA